MPGSQLRLSLMSAVIGSGGTGALQLAPSAGTQAPRGAATHTLRRHRHRQEHPLPYLSHNNSTYTVSRRGPIKGEKACN